MNLKEDATIYKEKRSFHPFASYPNLEEKCNLKLRPTTIHIGSLKAGDLGISCPTHRQTLKRI